MTEAIDWSAILSACARMGIPPPQVWSLSLAEWRALTGPSRHDALPRTAFDALLHRFPDTCSPRSDTP